MGEAYTVSYQPLDLILTIGGQKLAVTFNSCTVCGALINPDRTSVHTTFHANRREGVRTDG